MIHDEADRISDRERKCLNVLAEHYSLDQNCLYFRAFSIPTGLTLKQIRRSVRSLARKGLAVYVRGLFDEDGCTAGSGYMATKKGYDLIADREDNKMRGRE